MLISTFSPHILCVCIYISNTGSSAAKRRLFQGHLSETMEKESLEPSQGQLKTCKDDQKQINSLLKTIRPKVIYITDSSSFKRLVQKLAGNGRRAISSPPPNQELHDHAPVTSIEENGAVEICSLGRESYDEMQVSVYAEDFDIPVLSPHSAFTALQTAWMTQLQAEEFQYPEVSSWPVEGDPFQFYDGYSLQAAEEMLCAQYDLSELYEVL